MKKKRKRKTGPFICSYPECSKVFSRSDHLARHQVNHSSNKLKCEWPSCGRLFSRLDVKKKHENRHMKEDKRGKIRLRLYDEGKSTDIQTNGKSEILDPELDSYSEGEVTGQGDNNSAFFMTEAETTNVAIEQQRSQLELTMIEQRVCKKKKLEKVHGDKISLSDQEVLTIIDKECNMKGIMEASGKDSSPQSSSNLTQAELKHRNNADIVFLRHEYHKDNVPSNSSNGDERSHKINHTNSEPLSPLQSIQWLLRDSINTSPRSGRSCNQTENGAFHAYNDDPLGPTTLAMLEEIFALTPEFPTADCQTEVDEDILLKMLDCIPALKSHADFAIPKIKWFLEVYWLLYHFQYPILHRPSFSTFETQPLLLLCMIMMGASLSKKATAPENLDLRNPNELADMIAIPIRWLIFACEQAQPPCKSWVIQSLIILETYEITSTSRSLHERACTYNGAKIQLLRRSPILGGDPLKSVGSDVSQSNSLWNTWIESESMKRVALMSFYIDTIHAIVYGHPVHLFANQIKLSLPCPDDLWEYENVDRGKAPMSVAQSPLFCDALRKLLRKEPIDVGPFGTQILLAGLINLLLQIEQNISQWSNFGWESIQENWRDIISSAIEFWKTQLPGGNCCLTSSVYHSNSAFSLHPSLPPFLKPQDTRCSFPVYHAAQIYLKITHYDYIVYAGAPRRMNVPILPEDYEAVVKRIGKWVKSPSGPLCVINSIILLCEILLSPENSMEMVNYFYEPDKDPYLYRPNIVISAVLSLWAYAYFLFGPESSFKSSRSEFQIDDDCTPAMEDAPTYLGRIRNQFRLLTGTSFANLNDMNVEECSAAIKAYYMVFPKINHINYLVGLMTLLRNGYLKCRWDIGREYAKLLDNCIQRSLGSENIFCSDMYDVN